MDGSKIVASFSAIAFTDSRYYELCFIRARPADARF